MENRVSADDLEIMSPNQDLTNESWTVPVKSTGLNKWIFTLIASFLVILSLVSVYLFQITQKHYGKSKQKEQTVTNSPVHTVDSKQKIAPPGLTDQDFDEIFAFTQDQSIPWEESEKSQVKEMMSIFYPTIKEIYGERFDTSQKILISKLEPFSNENSYAALPNNVYLVFPVTKETVFHELVHLFHYPTARLIPTYEEGFARAVEVEGIKRIYGKSARDFYLNAALLELYNSQRLSNGFGAIASGLADVVIGRYELSAFAFIKAFYEDDNFFRKFNEEIYKRVKENSFRQEDLGDIFMKVKPTVENIPTGQWIKEHEILNFLEAAPGKHLLVDGLFGVNSFQLIERYSSWFEENLGAINERYANKPITLEYYDWNGVLFDTATITLAGTYSKDKTEENRPGGYYQPKFPEGYYGYYVLEASLEDAPKRIKTTVYGLYPEIVFETQPGIHGVVPGQSQGTATIYNADNKKISGANIVNGRFYVDIPSKGTYRIVVDGTNISKYVTKGESAVAVIAL